jgi:hypothetical protein
VFLSVTPLSLPPQASVFMSHCCLQYDRRNKRVGFLETDCNRLPYAEHPTKTEVPELSPAPAVQQPSPSPSPSPQAVPEPTPHATPSPKEAPGVSPASDSEPADESDAGVGASPSPGLTASGGEPAGGGDHHEPASEEVPGQKQVTKAPLPDPLEGEEAGLETEVPPGGFVSGNNAAGRCSGHSHHGGGGGSGSLHI